MDGNDFKDSIKCMSVADLHALYIFISGDFNKQFGQKVEVKRLVHARYRVVEEELNMRAYGCNPYETTSVEGDKPESIDLSKFDDKKGE